MRRTAIFLVVALALLALGLEIYARLPAAFPIEPLAISPSATSVVLIFHGAQDGGDPLLDEIAGKFANLATPGTVVINYRWDAGANNRLRAAANAKRLGQRLGTELSQLPQLRDLRLIAHSVGAYVPDAICDALRLAGSDAWIEITLLDPFGIAGFFDWRHGVRNHGRCADYAAAIINTDDPAPATNSPLQQAYNTDVTAASGRDTFPRNGHYWPLQYYRDRMSLREVEVRLRRHTQTPRGGRAAITD